MTNASLNSIISLCRESPLPALAAAGNLAVLWANPAALAAYPFLSRSGGLSLLLPDDYLEPLRKKHQSASIPIILSSVTLMFAPFDDGYLVQIVRETRESASALHPQGEGLFLSALTGQLRSPLSNIFASLSSIAQLPEFQDSERLTDLADQINDNCYRMLRFTACITSYLRHVSAQESYHFEMMDLRELLDRVGNAAALLTGAAGIPMQILLPPAPVILCGDLDKLTTALLHLISNCCRHTEEDNEITLSLAVSGNSAVITMADRGPGIPPDKSDKVFEPFFSYDHNGGPYAGIGLGLTLVCYIISHHNGAVALSSTEGEGTTVVISLPLDEKNDPLLLKEPPRVVDLLRDRYSQLHVLLSDTCGVPKP